MPGTIFIVLIKWNIYLIYSRAYNKLQIKGSYEYELNCALRMP